MTAKAKTDFWIVTTGQGLLPAGRKVGHVSASSPKEAEDALIASGQITEKWRGFFGFEVRE
ncbi:MAG: hypothetical protein K8U57_38530 [Planctomycetes bacterium]|nr:hypothetical protein [Planctomycetota bacterium]